MEFAYGYSAGGPVAIPLDNSLYMSRAPRAGYGAYNGEAFIDGRAAPIIAFGEAPVGDGVQQTAGAWTAGTMAGGAPIWTSVAVGLVVWAATKFLDRMIFHEGSRDYGSQA